MSQPSESWAHPGDLTPNEMRAHLALGRSILVSAKYDTKYDDRGNILEMVQRSPERHIMHPSHIDVMPAVTTKPVAEPVVTTDATPEVRESIFEKPSAKK
jgi:hypothetical protein